MGGIGGYPGAARTIMTMSYLQMGLNIATPGNPLRASATPPPGADFLAQCLKHADGVTVIQDYQDSSVM